MNNNLVSNIHSKLYLFSNPSTLHDSCYEITKQFYERVDKNVPPDSILFLGDSITQGLCVAAIAPNSINFGIGTDTTSGLLERIKHYQSIEKAKIVVLEIGTNDLRNGESNEEIASHYKAILDCIPPTVGIVCSAVLPINEDIELKNYGRRTNRNIVLLNNLLDKECKSRPGCYWINATSLVDSKGNLKSEYHVGDGIHLNQLGYSVWIEALKQGVIKAQN